MNMKASERAVEGFASVRTISTGSRVRSEALPPRGRAKEEAKASPTSTRGARSRDGRSPPMASSVGSAAVSDRSSLLDTPM
ncbi:hypothetical protein NL676_004346 [Syzygium grande]|nr:hypothetical protein NL676_004346 [Syzygium grande]